MKRPSLCLLLALASCRGSGVAPSAPRADAHGVPGATPDPLQAFTVEEKVAQLLVVGGHATTLDEGDAELATLRRLVGERRVGGVIWYRSKVHETAVANARLQQLAPTPLLVACDLEAGMGMRFDDTTFAPWAMAVAATGDPTLAERLGRATAEQARAIGIHQIYAPVADVNVDPANPVINVRSFGEDPADVARFVVAFCRGVDAGGCIATVKHFPGHGDTAVDSHRALPVLRVPRARLDAVELVPFRAAFAAGARSVMVAHLAVPALDSTPAPVLPTAKRLATYVEAGADEAARGGTLPATASPAITTDLLRRELGFDGLVVTDAMDMGGLSDHFDQSEGAVCAILAGADQILKPADPDAAIDGVVAAVRSGRIPQARLDASVERVLREKRRLGLFERRSPPPGSEARVGNAADEKLFEEVARRAVTLVREEPGVLPLSVDRVLHLAIADDAKTSAPDAFDARLASRGVRVESLRIDATWTPEQIGEAVARARAAPIAIVSLLARGRTGQSMSRSPAAAPSLVAELLKSDRPVVVVSFGSPYLLADLPGVKTYLAAYGAQDVMQRAVADALCGKAPIGGKLPVTIPGVALRGAGIARAAAP